MTILSYPNHRPKNDSANLSHLPSGKPLETVTAGVRHTFLAVFIYSCHLCMILNQLSNQIKICLFVFFSHRALYYDHSPVLLHFLNLILTAA